MPESRADRRKARYDYLISLGFSATEARKMRDHSGRHIERNVKQERKRIKRKKPTNRLPIEKFRLRAIENSQSKTTLEARERRFMSAGDRRSNFSLWSGNTGFPPWALKRIAAYNKAKRKSKFNSFGYRRFYYWYVERFADFENEFYADRGDSSIRNARGVSKRARTPALRESKIA